MKRIVFIYSTVDGHTLKICKFLAKIAVDHGFKADVSQLTPSSMMDLEVYDQIVIGASIRYGKHRPELLQFITNNLKTIELKNGAFFSVNAVARKPNKKTAFDNPYVRKFLEKTDWKPKIIGIFGGMINYPVYGLIDKYMILLIMWITKGPTNLNEAVDFTNWDEVRAFGEQLCKIK